MKGSRRCPLPACRSSILTSFVGSAPLPLSDICSLKSSMNMCWLASYGAQCKDMQGEHSPPQCRRSSSRRRLGTPGLPSLLPAPASPSVIHVMLEMCRQIAARLLRRMRCETQVATHRHLVHVNLHEHNMAELRPFGDVVDVGPEVLGWRCPSLRQCTARLIGVHMQSARACKRPRRREKITSKTSYKP